MALSHKDWELLNSLIWLTEMDTDRGLDFPSRPASRPVMFWSEKSYKLKCKINDCFHLTMFISVNKKKKAKRESKLQLEELNSAHRRSQAKCQLIQTCYI